MEIIKAFTLKFGGKNSWFDYHKRFLEANHLYRRNMYGFRKNAIKNDEPLVGLNSRQISKRARHLMKIIKVGKSKKISGYGIGHNWTKQSI